MNALHSAAGLLVCLFWRGAVVAGPLYEPLFGFDTGVIHPLGGDLIRDADGSFLGVSSQGGAYDGGLIYRVTQTGVVTTLLDFGGPDAPPGVRPEAGLLRDDSGILWGTTGTGNGLEYGTVFKFDPAGKVFTSLGRFTWKSGNLPGYSPGQALTDTGDGFLWGTTRGGGAADRGTVFKVEKATGQVTSVMEFSGTGGAFKGAWPSSPLLKHSDGYLWGTTLLGGVADKGVLYRLHPGTGAYGLAFEFKTSPTVVIGLNPSGRLQQDAAGAIWGTTSGGGSYGTVFKFSPVPGPVVNGVLTSVAVFTGGAGAVRGYEPQTGLVSDGKGFFWGTCYGSSFTYLGSVFKINAATGAFTFLFEFTGAAGAYRGRRPYTGLTDDGNGFLWGTTANGGLGPGLGMGTVYKISSTTGAFTNVARLTGNPGGVRGRNPLGGLTAGPDGNLWGTTARGSLADFGTVFKFSPATGSLTTVLEFDGASGLTRGQNPAGGLTNGGNGRMYGTTYGSPGSVFSVNAATGAHTLAGLFTGFDGNTPGSGPSATLTPDNAGFLWGLTPGGGAEFYGTAFKVSLDPEWTQTIRQFAGTDAIHYPESSFTRDASGGLWGVSRSGGSDLSSSGSVFRMSTSGSVTRMINFTGTAGAAKGSEPTGGLTSDGSGFFWGSTRKGGAGDLGTIYRFHSGTRAFTTVAEFTGTGGAVKGAEPRAAMLRDTAGNFWGTTAAGGAGNYGTVFRITSAGQFTTVLEFTGQGGAVPGANPGNGALYRHADGHLYGTTEKGGITTAGAPVNGGGIYRLRFGPVPVTLAPRLVGSLTATLAGTLNPNGASPVPAFEYGTSANLTGAAQVTLAGLPAGETPVPVAVSVGDLIPGTLYYCRLKASSPDNPNVQTGAIRSFRTPLQTAYSQWAAASGLGAPGNQPGADPDEDGLMNGVEYLFGTSPTVFTPNPAASQLDESGRVFRFPRRDAAETADAAVFIELSNDLSSWPRSWAVGAGTADSSPGISILENGTEPDIVSLQLPDDGGRPQYVRIRVDYAP